MLASVVRQPLQSQDGAHWYAKGFCARPASAARTGLPCPWAPPSYGRPPKAEPIGTKWKASTRPVASRAARLIEIHAASVDNCVDHLISAHLATDAIAAAESQIRLYPLRDRSRGLLIRALALAPSTSGGWMYL
jgi:hypothetical protein